MARVDSASAAVVFVFVIPEEFAAIVTNKYMERLGLRPSGLMAQRPLRRTLNRFEGVQ